MSQAKARPIKSVKEVHEYKGVRIIEWNFARAGQQFQVLDKGGYHYRYAYTLEDAQACVERVLKWGW